MVAVSGGASPQPRATSKQSMSASASTRRAVSARSCLVEARSSPLSRVDDHQALAEVGEADAVGLEQDVVGRVAAAAASRSTARRRSPPRPRRRDAHHARLAVDEAAAVGEHVERLVELDPHAGALQHLERREVDVVDLVGREDRQAQAAVAPAAGLRLRVSLLPLLALDTSRRGERHGRGWTGAICSRAGCVVCLSKLL